MFLRGRRLVLFSFRIYRISIFRRVLLLRKDIKCIPGKNRLLLRIGIARISSRAGPHERFVSRHFLKVRTFVIRIV